MHLRLCFAGFADAGTDAAASVGPLSAHQGRAVRPERMKLTGLDPPARERRVVPQLTKSLGHPLHNGSQSRGP